MNKLVAQAIFARDTARAPYSGYRVGCAVECSDGSIVCDASDCPDEPSNEPFSFNQSF